LNLDTYLFIHAAGCLNRTVSKTQKIQGTEDIKLVGSPELKSPSESCQLAIFRDIQHFVSIASAAASSSPETKLEEHCPSLTLKTQVTWPYRPTSTSFGHGLSKIPE
jgi:hypothetical protein